MDDKDHPIVFFPTEITKGINVAYGYLFIVDGVAWVAKTLEDAKSGVPAIPIPLDPKLLEEVPSTEQGGKQFQYLGLAPRD